MVIALVELANDCMRRYAMRINCRWTNEILSKINLCEKGVRRQEGNTVS